MSFLLYKNDEQSGPFTMAEIQAKLGTGEISNSDFVWKEGMTEWQPISSVIPPPPPKAPAVVPGMPPIPIQATVPVQSSPPPDPLAGNRFLMASLDKGSKNDWDVINVETGKIVICIRGGETGALSAVAKSGILDGWGGAGGLTKFNATILDPSGAAYMTMRGGGIGGHAEVFSLTGEKIGDIKKTSVLKLNFEAFAAEGILFKIVADGLGRLSSEQTITCKDGNQLGGITDSDWWDAKKTLGDKIRLVDTDSMFRSKYSYKHKIELKKPLSTKEKTFLFGTVYQLAHIVS